jgi:hypothetical protein
VADVELHAEAAGATVPGGPAASGAAFGEGRAAEHAAEHHAAFGVDAFVEEVGDGELGVVVVVGRGEVAGGNCEAEECQEEEWF